MLIIVHFFKSPNRMNVYSVFFHAKPLFCASSIPLTESWKARESISACCAICMEKMVAPNKRVYLKRVYLTLKMDRGP